MQQWVRDEGKRVVIVVEGRDAAGKGGVIKRITEYLNPRWCRIAALPVPSDREKTEWYFQRYIAHLPAGGEIVLFDRSWYNRAGVERVMGLCTDEEYHRFLRQCPAFERMLIDDGIILVKYWFSVSDEEQERRFKERLNAPLKRWKLSEMDIEGRNRWVEYSKAKDEMFAHCDLPDSPWYEVEADDKKRARLNCIAHLLSVIPYQSRKAPRSSCRRGPRRELPATAPRAVPPRSRLRGDDRLTRRAGRGPPWRSTQTSGAPSRTWGSTVWRRGARSGDGETSCWTSGRGRSSWSTEHRSTRTPPPPMSENSGPKWPPISSAASTRCTSPRRPCPPSPSPTPHIATTRSRRGDQLRPPSCASSRRASTSPGPTCLPTLPGRSASARLTRPTRRR